MTSPVSATDKMDAILAKFHEISRDDLIPLLQEVQNEFGFISEESLARISRELKLPASKIYGLCTFYNQFRFSPKGKYHIQVCNGTACHLDHSSEIIKQLEKILAIKDGETTRDGLFSLEILSCIGACGQSPVIAVNGEYMGDMDQEKLKSLISYYRDLGA